MSSMSDRSKTIRRRAKDASTTPADDSASKPEAARPDPSAAKPESPSGSSDRFFAPDPALVDARSTQKAAVTAEAAPIVAESETGQTPQPSPVSDTTSGASAKSPAPTDSRSGSFADLFEGSSVPKATRLSVGDQVTGSVVHVGEDGAFVELVGSRAQVFFPIDPGSPKPAVGDELRGIVQKIDGDTAIAGAGLGRGVTLEELQIAMRDGIPIEGKVSGVNKGGVKVDLGGTIAFCPISQLELHFVNDASVFLQKTLSFHVTEIKERDVVLSRRTILKAERDAQRDQLAANLVPGARIRGTVVRVVDFGAFVDLGGVDGLIPTRELTYDRRRPDQVVSTGQPVEVVVQEVTHKGDDLRITLSLKALEDDPWAAIEQVAPRSVVLSGKVRRVMDFGAFVELAPGIEGLLHISELGRGEQVHVGQELLVTVNSIDHGKKRVSLAPAPAGVSAGATLSRQSVRIGEIVDAVVEQHERFGVFVQIEGLSGKAGRALIHDRELSSDESGIDKKRSFPIGKKVRAKVIDTKRLALSIKAIAEDEARAEVKSYQAGAQSQSMGTFGDLLKKLPK